MKNGISTVENQIENSISFDSYDCHLNFTAFEKSKKWSPTGYDTKNQLRGSEITLACIEDFKKDPEIFHDPFNATKSL